MYGMQDHHIVFRSQGGLNFPLNILRLTPFEHTGSGGPHHNKVVDIIYKKSMQDDLYKIFTKDTYSIEEIAKLLGRPRAIKYFTKNLKTIPKAGGLYKKEELIKRLMGGQLY